MNQNTNINARPQMLRTKRCGREKQKNIQLILSDIYAADPSLKEHESELVKLIEELIKAKPAAEINEQFRAKLKREIMLLAREIKTAPMPDKATLKWGIPLMNQFLRPAGYVVLGALAVGLVVIPFLLKDSGNGVLTLKSPFEFQVSRAIDNAFGNLALNSSNSNLSEEGALNNKSSSNSPIALSAPQISADGMGGGGYAGVAVGADSSIASSEMMPIRMVSYRYVYKGEDFSVEEDKMEVFKRVTDSSIARSLANYLSKVKLGGLDLSKLKNAKLSNFTIIEDTSDGYSINVDLTNGMISLGRNWVYTTGYVEQKPLTKADIPNDAKIIGVADKFLQDFNVDLSVYGAPEVDKSWQEGYQKFESRDMYIPEYISVLYPLLLNGQTVYEQYGNKAGLYVSVNVRTMKVESAWNLTTQSYQSSFYETEQDTAKILKAIEQNNNTYYDYDASINIETIELELGTPEMILVRFANYTEKGIDELFAPALSFPVLNPPESGYYYQKNIIVPIIKEILDGQMNQIMPAPYPLMEKVESPVQ